MSGDPDYTQAINDIAWCSPIPFLDGWVSGQALLDPHLPQPQADQVVVRPDAAQAKACGAGHRPPGTG